MSEIGSEIENIGIGNVLLEKQPDRNSYFILFYYDPSVDFGTALFDA